MSKSMNALEQALRALLAVVTDAREDEDVDAMTTAGAYLCGDVMSEAIEQAQAALANKETAA
jgi:hypothetical protein